MYSQLIQRDINILRMNRQLRLLWPDYQVRDLLQQKTNLSDLHLITSNPILICKVDLSSKDIPQAIFSKNYSHLAVHKVIQLNEDFSPTPHYYAILSRRGFAVDELHSRYIRGNHIITAKIAQLQRQCNLWGAMSITSEERIIDSKYIVKRNNMWILQFESSKALKSILFYGTIRQPRYGKASGYNNELAKDAKLQFCMHVRNFQSFLDGFMNNLEEPIQTFHFFSSNYIHRIQMPNLFTKSSKTQKNIGKNQSQIKSSNSKTKFPLQVLKQQNSNKNQLKKPSSNQTLITIIQHCLDIQIHEQQANLFQIMQPFDDDLFLNSLLNQIDGRPETKRQMELFIEKIMEKSELNITTVQKASQFKQLSSNQSFNYIISVMTKIFITNSCKDIQIWLQLYVNIKKINSQQTKIILTKKLEHYFLNNYRQLLKNCLEQYIYQNIHLIEHLLRRQIARDLANYSNDSGQLSDILYILMNLEGKKDILQLYDLYKLANHSIYVAQSLRNYQISSKIFPKDNSNLLYENLTKINVVQYNSNNENQGNNQKRRPMQQFINLFTLHFSYSFQKNSFLSGKIIQIGNLMLKYYVWREEEYIHCFFQKINDQFNPTKNHLQMVYSFQIQVEMTIGSVKKQHCLSWNFSSPSHSVGYRYIITDTLQKVLVSYKATFKRAIFHQSILSYLKIRYQQSICSQNHPRQRLQSLNKKLSSRRSSLYLERNILGLESAQPLNNQCFYHKDCEQCIKTVKQNFIFHLRPLDLYSLLFSIRFNDEADALSVLFKYLLLNNQPQNNHLFWVSLLRIKYLSLTALLQTANNYAISTKIKPILSSLIEQKIIESCPSSKKIKPKFLFINGQASRRGDIFWRWIQKDYSEQYLQYLNNALQKL